MGEISGFSDRLREALRGRPAVELARGTGLSPQTIDGYLKGAMPAADRAFLLAEYLEVDARWLVKGEGQRSASDSDADWISLPRYDLFALHEHGKGPEVERVAVRRDWLGRLRAVSGLWLAEMPSDALPDVAREGDQLVCQDAQPPLADGRTYVFLMGGRPLVRKLELRPGGVTLKAADDAIMVSAEDMESGEVIPVARVLASLSLRPV